MPEGPQRTVQHRAAVLATVVLGGALVGCLLVAVVVVTPLQEVSFRWVGLAGVALPTAVGLAVAATAAATLVSWAAAPGRARSVGVAAGLVVPWAVVVWLAWPTLSGMVAPGPVGDGPAVTVLSQNLWYQNTDPDSTARRILARDADVLVLVEYTPAHAAALREAGLESRYRYRWEEPGELGGGLAVMSRLPLGEAERLDTWSGGVRIGLTTEAGEVTLVAVHPVAPSDFWGLRRWQQDYRTITAALADAGPATVVTGDLNATGAHRRLRSLMAAAHLRDARDLSGDGFGPTWPGTGPVPPVMRLDHVLVGPGIDVADVEVLGDVGADHRGVEATLRVGPT